MIEVPEKLPITIAIDIYIARPPISNRKQKVIGYELLYRSGLTNSYGGTDGTEASVAVIRNTFLFLGERIVPQPNQAFISLATDLLLNGVAGALPHTSTVMEIVEDIEPDKALIEKCQELKEAGYTLALDLRHPIGNAEIPCSNWLIS